MFDALPYSEKVSPPAGIGGESTTGDQTASTYRVFLFQRQQFGDVPQRVETKRI